MKKRILHNKLNFVGVTNALALLGLGGILLLGTLLVNPSLTISHTDAHAMSGTSNGATADSLSTTLSTKTTASLASMLSIALSDSIDIDITPQSKGALGLGKARLAVTTNNTTGYSIYLSTVDGSNSLKAIDQENQYVDSETGDKKDTTYAITAMNGTTEYSKYLDNEDNLNTWGYALTKSSGESADTTIPSDTKFTGLKDTAGDSIYYTKSTTSNDTYDLNIAVAVDASLPAGGYRNGIVVSAVANPIKISGFNSIYYMQEMTSDICASAQEHEEGQLVDKRDNKIYWVGKLKDGNCRMTQNLDLDLSTDVALTPEDTNVTEEWRPEVSTSTEIYQVEDSLNRVQAPQNSYDAGNFVPVTPDIRINCDSSTDWSACPDVFMDVSNYHPGQLNSGTTVDSATATYDSHYLIGNYYQPNAALVGKIDLKASSQRLDEDICPKGWKMPDGAMTANYQEGDWYRLVSQYGWDSDYKPNTGWSNFIYTSLTLADLQRIAEEPLYLATSGTMRQYSMDDNDSPNLLRTFYRTAYFTNYKSNQTTLSFFLLGMDTKMYPAASTWLFVSAPVRCLAK